MELLVKNHYLGLDLIQKIETALAETGKEIKNLELKDLASVDQLHTGGAPATMALLKKTAINPQSHVLDAGCGLGGSARLMANTCQCRVTGIDLSPSFIETAKRLTCHTKLENQVTYETGSVLALPFEKNSFDAILCQHILMNIQDKATGLKEFFRVLKPGGEIIFHEITKGNDLDLTLPVPWAGTSDISFIETWENLGLLLEDIGFKTDYFCDTTKTAVQWWQKAKAFAQKNIDLPRPLGPHLVFGNNAALFGTNMGLNFENNIIRLVEAVFKKPCSNGCQRNS